MRDCFLNKTVERDIARFEDEGGPPLPERDGGGDLDNLGTGAADYHERQELPAVPAIFGLKTEALPLAPPERPMMLKDTVARIAFIRDDQPDKPIAMELDFTGEDAIMAQAALLPGRVEIALSNGFGRVRQLQLSPAEFMLVMMYGDRFFAELPR